MKGKRTTSLVIFDGRPEAKQSSDIDGLRQTYRPTPLVSLGRLLIDLDPGNMWR